MKELTVESVQSELEKQPRPVLVNVLSASSFEKRHIPGSVNVPLEADDFVAKVDELVGGRGKPVVVYCASESCDASPKAAKKLESAGFENVFDFTGGVDAWSREGGKLEGTEAA